MADVRLTHVFKRFGEVEVVKDVNLEIHDGEFLVLVGPSGCGKTTILRMVAGLEEISAGDITIGDRLVNDVPPKDRDIAMVFQNYALYPHMSVFDNIACTLRWRGVAKQEIDPRVREAADILELTPYLKRKPKELSGGQRQRVALARAIVREPKVFLMDEPLSNLDARLRVQTRAEISRLHQRFKHTTIYVTHDQTEAMTMGDRIAVLSNGIIQQLGTPQELYSKPVNQFVAGFIGSPSMNFFNNSRVTRADGKMQVTIGNQLLMLPEQLSGMMSTVENRAVTVGLRPEDFTASHNAAETGKSFVGIVDVVENLGSEKLVYVRVGSLLAQIRVDPLLATTIGETITLTPRLDHIHIFDPETTKSLFANIDLTQLVAAQ